MEDRTTSNVTVVSPYRERFNVEEIPHDFSHSQLCKEYVSLLAILQVFLWFLETVLGYQEQYLPLLKKCNTIMHDKVIKPTHVLEEDFVVKHSSSSVAVRLLCVRFLSLFNVPIDVVTVSGTITKIHQHQLLDEHSTNIKSFLKSRERLNNCRLSNNFSVNTQHEHDSSKGKEGCDSDGSLNADSIEGAATEPDPQQGSPTLTTTNTASDDGARSQNEHSNVPPTSSHTAVGANSAVASFPANLGLDYSSDDSEHINDMSSS